MFTKVRCLLLFAALALTVAGISAAEAKSTKTTTQTSAPPQKPKSDRFTGRGGYGISTTTGWRPINGWEKSVVERNPNLQHWSWLGMQEMNKSYTRLRPGQIDPRRPRRYVKPIHISSTPHVARTTQMSQPTESRYVRPVHVGLPSRESLSTNTRLSTPSTSLTYSVPKTNARLASPTTSLRFAAPSPSTSTSLRLAAPSTNVRLAAPSTNARLASTQTQIKLTAPKKAPTDPMADCGQNYTEDTFQTPELENVDPYGPRTHRSFGYTKTSAHVRAKLVKKHR